MQAPEGVLVQALVSEAAVEALDEGVLNRFAGSDKALLAAALLLPCQYRPTGELRSVVGDDHQRKPAQLSETVEFARHAEPRQRHVDHKRQALAGEVVHHDQTPEATAVCGIVTGALVPSARLRLPRRRTVSRSSR